MIPVEYLWIALIIVFGFVGSARGLNREFGVTTILLLSLFVLKFGWVRVGERITGAVGGRLAADMVEALFYIIVIAFVAFISYEGITLSFPVRDQSGVPKGVFGFFGGLLNGYVIIGTIWDVLNEAGYLGLQVPDGSTETTIAIADYLTDLHTVMAQYLPVTFVNEFVFLILGMILLLAIVLK